MAAHLKADKHSILIALDWMHDDITITEAARRLKIGKHQNALPRLATLLRQAYRKRYLIDG